MTAPDFSISWPGRGRSAVPGADGPVPRIEALVTGDADRADGAGVVTEGAVLVGDGARIAEAHDALDAHGLAPCGAAQVVYLDPPYNRGGRFDAYHDNMPRHEWLDYIETRLVVARDLDRKSVV